MISKHKLRRMAGAAMALLPGTALAEAQQVAVSVVADLPVAAAWEKLRDFSLAHNYVPGIVRTDIISATKEGVGAHRYVYDEDGDYLEETVIEWSDGSGFVIKLHDGDAPMAPFERAEFSYAITPQGDNATLISLALTFQMPWGGFGETLGDWFIRPVMEENLVGVAAGMKHFYETGAAATDEDRERLAEAVTITSAGD